ncbi:fumarylacetoacetate hydrolase family protein [Streptomyces sp. Ru72]|uniref:fumarylacetoacetate hydrolase family protein n=1 Tax=Streptomyces sp. Ru72 TaxID=2080747 RepID=UPI000CDE3304|nr:fumarylacetoacetate hydrolase family protein [Streptomyces sp. Ru72]POX47941.1 hypothetical protein C3488_21995 [Streptomyces sp. Ru72]
MPPSRSVRPGTAHCSRSSKTTADLIFHIPELIKVVSAGITLQPGDIIATGTLAGVGICWTTSAPASAPLPNAATSCGPSPTTSPSRPASPHHDTRPHPRAPRRHRLLPRPQRPPPRRRDRLSGTTRRAHLESPGDVDPDLARRIRERLCACL